MTVLLLLTFLFPLRYCEKMSNNEIYSQLNMKDILPILSNIPLFKARTPSARKLNNPTLSARTINYGTLNSRMFSSRTGHDLTLNSTLNTRTPKHRMTNSRKLSEWLENIVPIPNKSKNFRRSHIEGLMDFKTRVNKNKLKKPKYFINDDIIIPNNKYEFENTFANLGDPVPNFNINYADFISRRFNKIHSEYLQRTAEEIPTPSNLSKSMRRFYHDPTLRRDQQAMSRVMALMTQFIYQAQNKMILSNLLREKYTPNIKFKIGYVFALLRILKQQQLRLYSSMHFYRFYTPDKTVKWYYTDFVGPVYYLTIYEKLMRLDDDIITLVRYLWEMEEERKKEATVDATRFPKRTKMTPPLTTELYYNIKPN